MYRPSELLAHLKAEGTSAKKRFSQNFLIDGNILNKIIKTADVQKGDIILEIGAGPGALTRKLLEQQANVIAIEIDPKLVSILKQIPTQSNLEIIQADVLTLPLATLCQERVRANKKIKVVANLPYHITTPILTRLLPLYLSIESITVMVQKEFGERMCAPADTEHYSSFSLFVAYYSRAKICFSISPSCFYPPPKVFSCVVSCTLHEPVLQENKSAAFFKLTRRAFQQRRKMLRTALKTIYPLEQIDQSFQKMGLTPNVRAEELSLAQFLSLFRMLGE